MNRSFEFDWDDRKAATNYRKHGIRFEEAALVFNDPFARMTQDRIEGGEMRWQTIGLVGGHLVVLEAHTIEEMELEGDAKTERVRIISARRADRSERRRYEDG